MMSTTAPQIQSIPVPSETDRKATLDHALQDLGRRGWRIENRSDHQATIAKGQRVHHLLHFFLTLFTLGVWLLVWVPLMMFGGVKRKVVLVDEAGVIREQRV
jgi:hypothetical protein